ncbi:MAG: iron-containing redox enzyme family protein [Bacteriovorax sp.]|nr:iron-containing redox enzyme family protein [Bacteriovorax sp.]
MNKNYQKQLKNTELLIQSLPWEDKAFYSNYLAQTYYFVCHSTRLLARSISHFGVERDSLYRRFVAHLKEENYHERIAESDLLAMGMSPNDFEELAITKAFWESQYYKIDQTKGTSLLGYILYLEAIPVHCFKGILKYFPENANRFLKVHMEEDPKHLDHVLQVILELSVAEQDQIWDNYHQTAELYQQMLLKLADISRLVVKAA